MQPAARVMEGDRGAVQMRELPLCRTRRLLDAPARADPREPLGTPTRPDGSTLERRHVSGMRAAYELAVDAPHRLTAPANETSREAFGPSGTFSS